MLNQSAHASAASGTSAQLDRALCVRLTGFVSFLRENGFSTGVDDAAILKCLDGEKA